MRGAVDNGGCDCGECDHGGFYGEFEYGGCVRVRVWLGYRLGYGLGYGLGYVLGLV